MALSLAAAAIGAAVIGGGASIIGGAKAAKATKQAANTQIGEQRRQYDLTRADYAPWREAGSAAITKMAGVYGLNGTVPASGGTTGTGAYGGFFESPDYQYRKDETEKAANRGLSSRGLLGSGGAVIAKSRLAGNLASGEYGDWWNRLAGIAGVGQTATAGTAAAGQAATNGITQAIGAAGNARASSYANTASAINGGINNVLSAYLYQQGGGFGGSKAGLNNG